MAAVATMSNPLSGSSHHKITKARSKVVKPILKKLSHSEKNSLDLDRGWDEQPMSQYAWAGGYEPYGSGGRSAKDVSFSFGGSGESGFGSVGDMNMGMGQSLGGFGGGSGGPGRPGGYRHARSTSGTSYASVATSSSGGPRGGTFIHPFQQTPRTATPPLSHANSTISFEHNAAISRDYSPTITEAEDSEDLVHAPTPSSFTAHSIHHHPHPASVSQSNLRRPSLASSQRTSSFSELAQSTVNWNGAPPLRVNTSRVFPPIPSSARQGRGKLTSSLSHSDLHLNYSDSPLSSTSTPLHQPPPPALISPSSSVSAMSPLRSSLEAFPRLRSRSELDTSQRAEHVREARRKFDERERLKEEKRGREEEKKQHRRDMKEAKEIERISAAQVRKNSAAGAELLHGPTQRPATSRKSTSNNSITGILGHGRSKSNSHTGIGANDLAITSSGHHNSSDNNTDEKLAFSSKKYDSVANGAAPQFGANVDDVRFVQGKRRTSSAKRKTQGVWTGIVLWVRTRLFRLGRK